MASPIKLRDGVNILPHDVLRYRRRVSTLRPGRGRRRVIAYLPLLAAVCACLSASPPAHAADAGLIERGRYIFTVAGCASCHTQDRDHAGGRALDTPFGTFHPPNITPDPEHGIGGWREADFLRALGEGVSPQGEHYYPAFPYTSYTRMTPADMRALYAYLMTRPAVARASPPHELPWWVSSRKLLGLWKAGRFSPGRYQYRPGRSAQWNRGAYLAQALGHCGECHTPRGPLGGRRTSLYLAGNRRGPEGRTVPNITRDRDRALVRRRAARLPRHRQAAGRRLYRPADDRGAGSQQHVAQRGRPGGAGDLSELPAADPSRHPLPLRSLRRRRTAGIAARACAGSRRRVMWLPARLFRACRPGRVILCRQNNNRITALSGARGAAACRGRNIINNEPDTHR